MCCWGEAICLTGDQDVSEAPVYTNQYVHIRDGKTVFDVGAVHARMCGSAYFQVV